MTDMKRDVGVAYLLALFLGMFGGHRFYVHKKGTAIMMLILTCSVVGSVVSGIWLLVDLFLLPSLVAEINAEIERHNNSR